MLGLLLGLALNMLTRNMLHPKRPNRPRFPKIYSPYKREERDEMLFCIYTDIMEENILSSHPLLLLLFSLFSTVVVVRV